MEHSEPGLAGIALYLAPASGGTAAGDPVRQVLTQVNGVYEFRGVGEGVYSLTVQEHPDLRATTNRKYVVQMSNGGGAGEFLFGMARTGGRLYLPLLRR